MKKISVFLILLALGINFVFCQSPKNNLGQEPMVKNRQTLVSWPIVTSGPITIKYYGTFTLKIVSTEKQGTELLGLSNSIDNSNARICVVQAQKNSDLTVACVIKECPNQVIWPRVEFSKYINDEDSVDITDSDVRMLALYEAVKIKFKVDAKGYKIFIPTDSGKLMLRHQSVSQLISLPIGQSYFQIAYKDSKGVFHPRVLLPLTVKRSGGCITITKSSLANALVVSNW